MEIIIPVCLILLFCLGDSSERGKIIIAVIGTIAYMWWYMKDKDR